jgi:hypothetical protein
MKTNYYLRTPSRWLPFHLKERVYLGQSIDGWTFALHVMPEYDIYDLPDMITWLSAKLSSNQSVITDNNGRHFSLLSFLEVITKRSCSYIIRYGWESDWWTKHPTAFRFYGYASEEGFHRLNASERGPSGLLRRQIDGKFCIDHGSGTWDLCIGDFA